MHALFVLFVAMSIILIATVAAYFPTFARRCHRRRAERFFSRRSCSDAIEQNKWRRHEPIIIHVPQYMVQPKLGWPGYKGGFYDKRTDT